VKFMKVIPAEMEGCIEEVKSMKKIDSLYAVKLVDAFGIEGESKFFVIMEYV
jgi:hypothetical protein